MYAMPLPMRKEIRFDFANRAGMHLFLRKDLAMQMQMSLECCTDSHLVGGPWDKRTEDTRVETLWIPLQDIVASTAILGEPITQSKKKPGRAIDSFRTCQKGTVRPGLNATCDHHACANSAVRPWCDHCAAVHLRYTTSD